MGALFGARVTTKAPVPVVCNVVDTNILNPDVDDDAVKRNMLDGDGTGSHVLTGASAISLSFRSPTLRRICYI